MKNYLFAALAAVSLVTLTGCVVTPNRAYVAHPVVVKEPATVIVR